MIQDIIQELDRRGAGAAFIKGTKVLVLDEKVQDEEEQEYVERNVEDVCAGDFVAFFDAENAEISKTRVMLPPLVDTCTDYTRLHFSDGRTVDVYGKEFFVDADTGALVDWKTLSRGLRVHTEDGGTVTFTGAEKMTADEPVCCYTLMTMDGGCLAGGLQFGNRAGHAYFYMMGSYYKPYFDALTAEEQARIKDAFTRDGGLHGNTYKTAYETAVRPLLDAKRALQARIDEKKAYLAGTDYLVIKYAEGLLGDAELDAHKSDRQAARDAINAAQTQLAATEADIETAERAFAETLDEFRHNYDSVFDLT